VKDSIRSKKAVVNNIEIVNSTAPAAHKDNQIYILSKDASTSNESTLHLFLEEDPAADTLTTDHKLKIWINGAEYYLGLRAV